MSRPTSQRPSEPPHFIPPAKPGLIVDHQIEVIRPDYCEAFGNLARLVTGAIASTDEKVREEYLHQCQILIEQVYNPLALSRLE